MVTPAHIVPEWYFLPFYAILRSIPDKLGGVIAMVGAILILLTIPFTSTTKIRSPNFRPFYRVLFWITFFDFLVLGWIGQKLVETPYIEIGQFATILYFAIFAIFIPFIGTLENSFVLGHKENR
jgi:ubiquinol-cytochrome c reductase cytochrome b subunit